MDVFYCVCGVSVPDNKDHILVTNIFTYIEINK